MMALVLCYIGREYECIDYDLFIAILVYGETVDDMNEIYFSGYCIKIKKNVDVMLIVGEPRKYAKLNFWQLICEA